MTWIETATDVGISSPVLLQDPISVAVVVAFMVLPICRIVKGPVSLEDYGPATFSDYMSPQKNS